MFRLDLNRTERLAVENSKCTRNREMIRLTVGEFKAFRNKGPATTIDPEMPLTSDIGVPCHHLGRGGLDEYWAHFGFCDYELWLSKLNGDEGSMTPPNLPRWQSKDRLKRRGNWMHVLHDALTWCSEWDIGVPAWVPHFAGSEARPSRHFWDSANGRFDRPCSDYAGEVSERGGRGWRARPKWLNAVIERGWLYTSEREKQEDRPEWFLKGAERNLRMLLRRYGPEEAPIAPARGNVANKLEGLGRFTEARPHREEILALYRKHLGLEDPATLTAELSLGVNLTSQGLPKEARPLFAHVSEVRRRTLGPKDEQTITADRLLASVHGNGESE
jgi:hypothetical protein